MAAYRTPGPLGKYLSPLSNADNGRHFRLAPPLCGHAPAANAELDTAVINAMYFNSTARSDMEKGATPRTIMRMQNPASAASSRVTLNYFGNPGYKGITRDQLARIMPNAGTQVDVYLDPLNSAMERHGINTPGQQAAFLAQLSVESGQLRSTNENLNYSARRLTEVWPSRFPNEKVAAPYANNPEALGNFVYANRLGNGNEASGDGYRYRGRGLMQTTGRANYRAAGFEGNPDALREPNNAANSAGRFWIDNGLNDRTAVALNRTQFNAITAVVNGGQHGATARWQIYQRALPVLGW